MTAPLCQTDSATSVTAKPQLYSWSYSGLSLNQSQLHFLSLGLIRGVKQTIKGETTYTNHYMFQAFDSRAPKNIVPNPKQTQLFMDEVFK